MPNPWKLRGDMCEVGRRMVERGLVAAFEGNLSARLAPDRILCTPSLVGKGALRPEDLCVVDPAGKQVSGTRARTSEVLLHLAIYRERPDVEAIVHAHPPHAVAFALVGEPLPTCLLAEVEVFLGEVPLAPYATPGSQEFAERVAPLARDAHAVLLANHGTVAVGKTLEEALFRTEILEAYARVVLLSRALGRPRRLSAQNVRDLLELKQRLGLPDRRRGLPDAELCPAAPPGAEAPGRTAPGEPAARHPGARAGPGAHELESLVREIVDRVVAELDSRAKGPS